MTEQVHAATRCPICGGVSTERIFTMRQMPVLSNVLSATRTEALQLPRADIDLNRCGLCGHIFNAAFDAARVPYTDRYENSLLFSDRFRGDAEALAADLIGRHALRSSRILDIGCGTGEFLALLCRLGDNQGLGLEPSGAHERPAGPLGDRVAIRREQLSERHAEFAPDLVCCRHVLEHLAEPLDLLRKVRDLSPRIAFFEVPNGSWIMRSAGVWDVIYEHHSYFTAASLGQAFATAGFTVSDLREAFEGQFLRAEATPTLGIPTGATAVRVSCDDAASFKQSAETRIAAARGILANAARDGRRVAVWGAGSKGVTFLNHLARRDEVAYVVDVNTRKQGCFVAGSGHLIVAPSFLHAHPPGLVLLMNPAYETEVRNELGRLGCAADLLCP